MMRLVFVGTGVSCAIPVIGHLDNGDACACAEAMANADSPNRRNNVSLLIQLDTPTPTDPVRPSVNVLVDCGKTFREAYFRTLAPRGVTAVDALLLTHGHADAMQCVEELCGLHTEAHKRATRQQRIGHERMDGGGADGGAVAALLHIPAYMTAPTLREVEDVSPQLVRASRHLGNMPGARTEHDNAYEKASAATNGRTAETTSGATLDIFLVPEDRPRRMYLRAVHGEETTARSSSDSAPLHEVHFYTLPVEHGANYISLGFVFGSGVAFKQSASVAGSDTHQQQQQKQSSPTREELAGRSCVVYISDVSTIIPASMEFLESLVKIDILVFDLLAEKGRSSPPHTCWDDCMPIIRRLAPRKTYFVGMYCSLLHEPANKLWAEDLAAEKEKVRAQLASGGANADDEAEVRRRLEDFLSVVESAELAFDGQELTLPL